MDWTDACPLFELGWMRTLITLLLRYAGVVNSVVMSNGLDLTMRALLLENQGNRNPVWICSPPPCKGMVFFALYYSYRAGLMYAK